MRTSNQARSIIRLPSSSAVCTSSLLSPAKPQKDLLWLHDLHDPGRPPITLECKYYLKGLLLFAVLTSSCFQHQKQHTPPGMAPGLGRRSNRFLSARYDRQKREIIKFKVNRAWLWRIRNSLVVVTCCVWLPGEIG
jgi:hypothetical protein